MTIVIHVGNCNDNCNGASELAIKLGRIEEPTECTTIIFKKLIVCN